MGGMIGDGSKAPAESPRIVLAHDWLVGMRGGERVLDRLAQAYGPTTLYTLVNDQRPLSRAIDSCDIVSSPLQRLPGASGRLRRWYLPLMPWAVSRLRVASCDLIISTSSAVMKSVRPPEGAKHLCYCHSPARYIWEQGEDYTHGRGGKLRRIGLASIRRRFQNWDRETASRVTRFLANSAHTAARIQRCYGREAIVVHPPVRTGVFTPDASVQREEWFLVVSALEPYKRTDLVVRAANEGGIPLKVAGSGSQLEALRSMAGPTVDVLGRVDESSLISLYRRARALVFPQVEDFGLTCVEAQATGCPVIAFDAGGAVETVTAETGLLLEHQSVEAFGEAMQAFDSSEFESEACRANAERFSEQVFDDAMAREVTETLAIR